MQALCFAEVPEKRSSVRVDYYDSTFVSLLHERIVILSNLRYIKEALEDVKVLEEFICNFQEDSLAPKLPEYYKEFFTSLLVVEAYNEIYIYIYLFMYMLHSSLDDMNEKKEI